MASNDIEILVHHDFLNSLNPRPLARELAHNSQQRTSMLSYTTSSPRTRIDNGVYDTSTPLKQGTTPMVHRNASSMSEKNSPSYPLPPTNNDMNSNMMCHDREDVRDDTVAQTRRVEWDREQARRFQNSPSPPLQPQVHHVVTAVDRARHQRQRFGDDSWTASQIAAHQAAYQASRMRSWSGHHPAFRHAHSDTEADTSYTSPSYKYPVADSQRRGGYIMQLHPRGTSFEQQRSPQAHQHRILLHSQATPPVQRYDDRPRDLQTIRARHQRSSENYSSFNQVPPQGRFDHHPIQSEREWQRQQLSFHAHGMAVRESMSSRMGGMTPVESHERAARTWSSHSHHDSIYIPATMHNSKAETEDTLVKSSSSSIMRRGPNSNNDTKASPAVEVNPSEQSDESSLSTAALTVQDTPPSNDDRLGDRAKRFNESSFGSRPVISEYSNQSYEPAPSKRMRPAYDYPIADATNSLELLCSATLDLGPLQENATGCSCPRSNCIKLYCDCFKAGRRCTSKCSCTNCKNTAAESGINGERTRAIKNLLARNPRAFTGGKKETASRKPGDLICNCVKSRCLKLYCDCFQKGKLCNDGCSCVSCLNTEEESRVGGRRKMAIQQALEKRPDAFTKKPKEIGSGCACKNNR